MAHATPIKENAAHEIQRKISIGISIFYLTNVEVSYVVECRCGMVLSSAEGMTPPMRNGVSSTDWLELVSFKVFIGLQINHEIWHFDILLLCILIFFLLIQRSTFLILLQVEIYQ